MAATDSAPRLGRRRASELSSQPDVELDADRDERVGIELRARE